MPKIAAFAAPRKPEIGMAARRLCGQNAGHKGAFRAERPILPPGGRQRLERPASKATIRMR
jgi:hypothetical protein